MRRCAPLIQLDELFRCRIDPFVSMDYGVKRSQGNAVSAPHPRHRIRTHPRHTLLHNASTSDHHLPAASFANIPRHSASTASGIPTRPSHADRVHVNTSATDQLFIAKDYANADGMMPRLHRIAYQNAPPVGEWSAGMAMANNSLPAEADSPAPLPNYGLGPEQLGLELVQPTHDYTVVVYSVLLVFGFLANLYILLRYLHWRLKAKEHCSHAQLQQRARYRLVHVALANILVVLFAIPMELGWRLTIEWRAGNVGCKLLQLARVLGLYALANILTAVAADKALHVRLLLRVGPAAHWSLGSTPIKALLAGAWIFSALCSLPQVLVFEAGYTVYSARVVQCVGVDTFASLGHEHLYNIFMLAGMFLLPSLAMLAAYAYVFHHIHTPKDLLDADLDHYALAHAGKEPEETSSLSPQQRARVFSAGGQSRVSAYTHILSLQSGSCGGATSEAGLVEARGDLSVRAADGVVVVLEEAFERELRAFAAMSLTFIVTATPYVAFTLWYLIDPQSHARIHPILQELPFVLVLTNTLLLPAIHMLRLCVAA